MCCALCGRSGRLAFIALAALLLSTSSCETPGGVAQFCSSAVTTLKTGDALFEDMKASCERIVAAGDKIGAFPTAERKAAACDDIGKHAADLKKESQKLADYFAALNELASFNSSKAQSSASEAAEETKLPAAERKALGSIGSFLTQAATSGYQQKALAEQIVKMREDVDALLNGLGKAAGVVYAQQLTQEQAAVADRYRNFLLEHPNWSPDTLLTLDSRWQGDRAALAAKLKSAATYPAALETIAKGNNDLAAHAQALRAKELPGLLSPYATQLNSMISRIQKAF
jgi:hypothetical protein